MDTPIKTPNTQNGKFSELVSLKTAFLTSGSLLGTTLFAAIAMVSSESFMNAGASVLNAQKSLDTGHVFAPIFIPALTFLGLIIGGLFFSIFLLYIFAKTEGQKHGDKYYMNTRSYAYKNFPSIFAIEALTLLYVILILISAIVFIAKLNLSGNEESFTENFKIFSSIAFAVLGGALSQLYYFLNKVQPQDLTEENQAARKRMSDFDINRVLRYLSFPFMSGGMGILAYTLVKGSGTVLGMETFSNPSYWFLMLIALTSGYFSDIVVLMFHRVVRNIEDKIPDGDDDSKTSFEVKKIEANTQAPA